MRTTILATALMLSATFLSAQIPMNPTAVKTNAILRAVELLKADAGYTTKTLNTEQFLDKKSGESGQLIGYYKDGKLMKMHVRIGMPTCVRTDKYYMQNDSLIMFYRQERNFQYNADTKTYDAMNQTNGMECRYYYEGNQILKTDYKGEAKCTDKPSDQQATELIATCKKYMGLLKK